jgi:hypothetical protein
MRLDCRRRGLGRMGKLRFEENVARTREAAKTNAKERNADLKFEI